MPSIEENFKTFEGMGLDRVKFLISTGGLPLQLTNDAIQWAAEKINEERKRDTEAKQQQATMMRAQQQLALEQKQIALDQKAISIKTLKVTWLAAWAAIFAVVVAGLAWIFPHL